MREPPLSLGAKTVLALRIWGTYARVRAIERHRPLPEVARRLARPPGRLARRVSPDRLGCAVDACLWPVGRPPRCLHSSLVLYRLLRAQGDRPALLVGLMSGTTSHRAHAWVELDGVDVGPPAGARWSRGPRAVRGVRVSGAIWAAVDRWVDAAPTVTDLEEHRLELLAARRLRALGRPVPSGLLAAERDATVVAMTAPLVLDRVCEAVADPLLLFKGPEVAALYPDRALRAFHDLDLLVPDAEAVQARLLGHGFVEVGMPALYEKIHHLRPLQWPGLPVLVEVHRAPKWVGWGSPPGVDELLGAAVPAACRRTGVLALAPSHHALVLAAHSWSNVPLGRLRDLLDIHLVASRAARGEVEATARAWGLDRVWRTTAAATAALLEPRPTRSVLLSSWARNLRDARGRTVLEHHLERWSGAFWSMPPRAAISASSRAIVEDLRPDGSESWAQKLCRSAGAVRDAGRRKAHHDRRMDGPR